MNPTIKASMYFSAKKKKRKKRVCFGTWYIQPTEIWKKFSRVHGYSAFPVGKKVTLKKRRTFWSIFVGIN